MKKFILIIGTLLFAAVFMSGCVAETDDPVVGIWMNTEPMQHPSGNLFDPVTYVFNADGTGYTLVTFNGKLVSGKLDITWKNLGGGKYELTKPDFAESLGAAGAEVFTLADGKLTIPVAGGDDLVLVPASLEEYAPGLWVSDTFDYQEYGEIKVLLYLGADKTGNVGIIDKNVTELSDIRSSDLTWTTAEDRVVITGPQGKVFELSLVDGGLRFNDLKPMQKYTVTDHLLGIWASDEPYLYEGVSYDVVLAIAHDGTGIEFWFRPDADTASETYPFTMEMTSPYSFKAVYDAGAVLDFYFSGDIQLFDGETWYSKVSLDVLQNYEQSKVTA